MSLEFLRGLLSLIAGLSTALSIAIIIVAAAWYDTYKSHNKFLYGVGLATGLHAFMWWIVRWGIIMLCE